ncbi:hypothetical protein [Saccharothrix xinjiangensis]|uniref:Uncharacterized protein n=1 Tax=Saccharothrix xinjiangensis TaxID=204798 RepID=A0ABV9Y5J2_9PSEU
MTQRDDFLGGLHYDVPREARVGPDPGIVRHYAVETGEKRVRAWWHLSGAVLGALAAVAAAFAWGYGIDQFDEVRARGLVALGLAGLLVGLVCLGKLSPAAPLAAGITAITCSVVYELGLVTLLPVLRTVCDSGAPVFAGVLLIVCACHRR